MGALAIILALGAADAGAVAEVLRARGIRPVLPASGAVDFTLADLKGTPTHLSDWRGNWVLLTFFATWCGPCATEMPSLQKLNDTEHRVQVIGIATDGQVALVQAFAQQHALAFPVLVDDGQVASIYHASSIPTSYVISPAGQIVGVARGARDWLAEQPTFVKLAELIAPDPEAAAQYEQNVELPATLVPPEARVRLEDAQPTAGRAFRLAVDVTWAGDNNDYVLMPPHVTLPAGLAQIGTSGSSNSSLGRTVMTYHLELRAENPGTYDLSSVEVRYLPRMEQTPLARRVTGPRVEVAPRSVAGLAWSGGVLGAVALASVALWTRRRRPLPPAPTNSWTTLEGVLHRAKAARLAGDVSACMLALAELDHLLGEAISPDFPDILERARYGGQLPAGHVVEGWIHRAAREVAARRPEEDA